MLPNGGGVCVACLTSLLSKELWFIDMPDKPVVKKTSLVYVDAFSASKHRSGESRRRRRGYCLAAGSSDRVHIRAQIALRCGRNSSIIVPIHFDYICSKTSLREGSSLLGAGKP